MADSRHFEDERRVANMRAKRAYYFVASGVRARSDLVKLFVEKVAWEASSKSPVDALRGD